MPAVAFLGPPEDFLGLFSAAVPLEGLGSSATAGNLSTLQEQLDSGQEQKVVPRADLVLSVRNWTEVERRVTEVQRMSWSPPRVNCVLSSPYKSRSRADISEPLFRWIYVNIRGRSSLVNLK